MSGGRSLGENLQREIRLSGLLRSGPPTKLVNPGKKVTATVNNPSITRLSTARMVERTRRELFASISNPSELYGKVQAYTHAIRRHRQSIFADIRREMKVARAGNSVSTLVN